MELLSRVFFVCGRLLSLSKQYPKNKLSGIKLSFYITREKESRVIFVDDGKRSKSQLKLIKQD